MFEYAIKKALHVLEVPVETTACQVKVIGQAYDFDPVNVAFTKYLMCCVQLYFSAGLLFLPFRYCHRRLY